MNQEILKKCATLIQLSACCWLGVASAVLGMKNEDIPQKAPQDGVMAGPAELAEVSQWAAASFAGSAAASKSKFALQVVRQDFNTLHFGESCMETPLRIGSKSFQHGLGTHANSEIVVSLPKDAKSFEASVGIDNNYDTQGQRGSVEFRLLIGGKEVLHTPTLKGGDEPVVVKIPLPADAASLTLAVDTTADGPAYDQSDWADARIVTADGRALWLDADRPNTLLYGNQPPFSFDYDGQPSAPFLKQWKHTSSVKDEPDRLVHEVTWTDSKTGLSVIASAAVFKEYPAVDWLLRFENHGSADTPIIENIRTADLFFNTGNDKREMVLHQLRGDTCSATSFTPFDTSLLAGQKTDIAPTRGRPSQETGFPFWNLQYRDRGIITAIGWSGQWAARYERSPQGLVRFMAGLEKTHLVLHPGEAIRSPRVLLMTWSGDRWAAHNRFRRLMLFHYVPQLDGRPLRLPIALQTFDRYISRPGWATEAGQLQGVEAAKKLGCDTYWFDAGWFVGGFPNGAGNWYHKPAEFPHGLRPIGDLCHQNGLQFVLWFEPCRVAPDTQIANEHPEFVLGGKKGGLFNLGDPAARRWITDLISKRISEYGIDVYREDYNLDPLGYWRANDPPDRQGMTEIRFVEGHYAFWDELRASHPGLWIDNCASGGRRIDLETCMRSVPLWRSDTSCSPGHIEWNQQQSMSLGQYVPLQTACAWDPESYVFRSTATGGLLCQLDFLKPDFPWAKAKALLEEAKDNQKFWYGDFYPLTAANSELDQFTAYQLHRADLDAGVVLAFRRPGCDWKGAILDIRGLKPTTNYRCEFIDEAGERTSQIIAGQELQAQGLILKIPAQGQSLLVRYTPAAVK